MHRFALAALLALSIVGLSGCGPKNPTGGTKPAGAPTSTSASESADATSQAAPGSAAWKEEIGAYFAQRKVVSDKELAQGQALFDILQTLDAEKEPSKAQIAKLVEASKSYPQLVTDAQAITPPKDLTAFHAMWLQTITAERDTMSAMADAISNEDLAKAQNAEKLFTAADTAQKAQDAELKRFNTVYGTDYK